MKRKKAESLEKFRNLSEDEIAWEWVSNELGILEKRIIPKPRGEDVEKA